MNMQFKGIHGSRGPVTRIIRANNVYPTQRVEECIDMEKSCSDQCQIIDQSSMPPPSSCRHHHWFETRWVYSYNCCRCLGDFVTLPVWLIFLISTLTLLAFITLAVIFGVLFGMNHHRPSDSPPITTTPAPSCFNNGVYNYYYQRCDCPESTCGEFCENCSFLMKLFFPPTND